MIPPSAQAQGRSCVVVGAGMAGLTAAHALQSRGYQVAVVDKGRNPGGRMATRSTEAPAGSRAAFDHGAQFLTVRSERFACEVATWVARGRVREWSRGFADATGVVAHDGHPRYAVTEGMSALARDLAASLPVRLATTVTSLAWHRVWSIGLSSRDTLAADVVVLTPPVEQSLALLDTGGTVIPSIARAQLERIAYDPCFALLVELDGPSAVPEPGAVQLQGDPILWMADNHRKGISPGAVTVTIHAGVDFTRHHWDAPHDAVAADLIDAARPWLGAPVRRWQVHRWRYSRPCVSDPEPCLRVDVPGPVVFAGDAFGARPHVEGAFLSGLAAAAMLGG